VRTEITAVRSGFVSSIDSVALGEEARDLVLRDGPLAGIRARARTGDAIRAGETLATVFGEPAASAAVAAAFTVADAPPLPRPLVYCEIGSRAGAEGVAATAVAPRSTLETR
jgi:thymidine phosphorylase